MKKRIMAILLIVLCLGLVSCDISEAAPGNQESSGMTDPTEAPAGQVRILNKDPQLQAAWESLAAEYSDLTGVEVVVLSSADEEVPTLLNVSEQGELPENCADLSETAACAQLASWDLTLRNDAGQVCAIAAEVEVFGLVYNSTLLAKSSNTRADINCFADLTEVVYSITDRKLDLGFSAFARVAPNDHFSIQLASLTGEARNLVDLIINNTTCDPMIMEESTEPDALQDFLDEKAVFFLAGSKEHETLNAIGSENMGVLPVYMGGENEENQSLCAAACSYWCVDGSAAEQDVQATVAFLNFLVQPRADGTVPVDDLGRVAPYRQATYVSNMLEVVFRSDLAMGKAPVVCRHVSQVPEGMTEALIAYAADPSNDNWEAIVALMGE